MLPSADGGVGSRARRDLDVDQVREFLKQMNEDSEFDDIELDAVALAAVAGGQKGQGQLADP